jgi:hypothetical protein
VLSSSEVIKDTLERPTCKRCVDKRRSRQTSSRQTYLCCPKRNYVGFSNPSLMKMYFGGVHWNHNKLTSRINREILKYSTRVRYRWGS